MKSRPNSNEQQSRPRRSIMVLMFTIGCAAGVLLYWNRPSKVGERPMSSGPSRRAPGITESRRYPEAAVAQEIQNPVAASNLEDANEAEVKVLEPIQFWKAEKGMLGTYLKDADPAKLGGLLETLSGEEMESALNALRELAVDTTAGARVQALHLLLNWTKVDEETLGEIFKEALSDEDGTFGLVAVGMLASRPDAQAIKTLSDAYNEGDASQRLLIVQSIGIDSPASAILNNALRDPEEMVRNSAMAILNPPNDENLQRLE